MRTPVNIIQLILKLQITPCVFFRQDSRDALMSTVFLIITYNFVLASISLEAISSTSIMCLYFHPYSLNFM